MVVVVTPNSSASPYVTYEWGFALGKGKKVVPVLLETSQFHPRLEVLHYLDFRDNRSAPWGKLTEEIKSKTSDIPNNEDDVPVTEMTSEDLKAIVTAAVSLANAEVKINGHQVVAADGISQATESILGAMGGLGSEAVWEHRNPQILWVDDRPGNNVYERSAFEALGFSFTLAKSTKEALGLLKYNSYAAIISDMGRVEGPREGYVLLKAVRQQDDQTPFFIYAGSNAPEHKKEALRRGAQGSTNRPQDLMQLVTNALQQGSAPVN